MASILSAGTSSGTALNLSGDTSGILQLASNNGTVGLTMDTSQNVGIGTSSPASKLNVSNSANSATSITITNTNGGASAVANTKYTNSASTHEFGILPTGYGGYGVLTAGSAYVYAGNNQALEFAVDNNYMAFGTGTGATERMRIDSSGNVGIGTTATGTKLNVLLGTSYTIGSNWNSSVATFGQATSSGGIAGGALGVSFDTTNGATLSSLNPGVSWYQMQLAGTYIAFRTGGSATEAARIDGSGNLLVGTTAAFSSGLTCIAFDGSAKNGLNIKTTYSSTGSGYIGFYNSAGTQTGYISQNGTTTVNYVTSSDYRLKENIVPLTDALVKVAKLKPVTYTWKDTNNEIGEGFIAHELQEVCPLAVSGEKDEVNEDGSIKAQGIDPSKIIGLLTAAIQEQQALITTLQTQVAALQAKVGA